MNYKVVLKPWKIVALGAGALSSIVSVEYFINIHQDERIVASLAVLSVVNGIHMLDRTADKLSRLYEDTEGEHRFREIGEY